MLYNRFDMEQKIFACWSVIEDIKVLRESMDTMNPSQDDLDNYLLGLETIYSVKFNQLFEMFEASLKASK